MNSLSQNHSLPKTNAVLTVAQVSVEGTIGFDSHAQGDFISERLARQLSPAGYTVSHSTVKVCSAFDECM